LVTILFAGCSSTSLITTQRKLPPVYVELNATHQIKNDVSIALFRFYNYTDTPRAGLRAANITEGVLLAKGYKVISHLSKSKYSLKKIKKEAKKDNAKYFLIGGVSEWRYKTGIDGEPAVSLKLSLYKTKSGKLIWSATGADSDWGNGSIGTTAQNLIETMMAR
jgi:TolB-like protein